MGTGRTYKGLEVYCCLALNRIASQLGIDLYQPDLEGKLDRILADRGGAGIPKVAITEELRANHLMTNKVIDQLMDEGLIEMEKEERTYKLKITKKGVLHLRKYNEFYSVIFKKYILDHYKFSDLPSWYVDDE